MPDGIFTPDMARRLAAQQQLSEQSAIPEGPMLDGLPAAALFSGYADPTGLDAVSGQPEVMGMRGVSAPMPPAPMSGPPVPIPEGPLLDGMAADRLFRQPAREVQMTPSRGSALAVNLMGRPSGAGTIRIPQDSLIQQHLPEDGMVSQAAMLRAIEAADAEKEALRQSLIQQYNALGYDIDPNTRLRDLQR